MVQGFNVKSEFTATNAAYYARISCWANVRAFLSGMCVCLNLCDCVLELCLLNKEPARLPACLPACRPARPHACMQKTGVPFLQHGFSRVRRHTRMLFLKTRTTTNPNLRNRQLAIVQSLRAPAELPERSPGSSLQGVPDNCPVWRIAYRPDESKEAMLV